MTKQEVRDRSVGKFTVFKEKIVKIIGVSRNGNVFNFGLDAGLGIISKREHELVVFLDSLSDSLGCDLAVSGKKDVSKSLVYHASGYVPNQHMNTISDGLMKLFNSLENSEGEELDKITSKIETACLVSDAMVKMEMATIKGLGLINKI